MGSLEDRYSLGESVGMGQCAEVLRARDRASGQPVAIKRWFQRLVGAQEHLQFRRELRAMEHVEHPAIVDVLDAGTDADGRPCIVMPLLQGESLRERLSRGPLSVDETAHIFAELLDALAAVHTAGFIHRDLKPENVFLCTVGPRVRLLDFGLARRTVRTFPNLSVQGFQTGTMPYMAPELIAANGQAGPASDVWAVGVMFYEALAARRPFEGATPAELAPKIRDGTFVPLLQQAPHVPAEVSALVGRCLQREPGDRFADAGALLSELSEIRRGRLGAFVASTTPSPLVTMAQSVAEPLRNAPVRAGAAGPPSSPRAREDAVTLPFASTPARPQAGHRRQEEPCGGACGPRGRYPLVASKTDSPAANPVSTSPDPIPPPSQPPNTEPLPVQWWGWRWIAATLLLGALGGCGLGALLALGSIVSSDGTVANDRPSSSSYGDFNFGLEPLFYSHTRPILADIDGDGIQDLIGSGATGEQLLVVASGARADTLWTYVLPADTVNHSEPGLTFAAPAHQLVLHIDREGTAIAIDGRTGAERWRAELGEPMQRSQPLPCVTADTAYVRSPQDFWVAINLESGAHRDAGPPDGACDPRRPLGVRLRNERGDDDSTGWESVIYTRAALTGDSAVWRRGWLLPEQPRMLVEGSAMEPSGRSVAVLAVFETHLGRRGHAAPADTPLWQNFVAERPEVTATGGIRNVTAHGNHLFVVYDMVRSRADSAERVAAFDLGTGARIWDTALERNTGRVAFIEADADRVWVGHQALEILDRRTGEHLGRVGRWH